MSNLGKRKEIFRQITAAPKTGRNNHQRLWNTFREFSSNSSGKISGDDEIGLFFFFFLSKSDSFFSIKKKKTYSVGPMKLINWMMKSVCCIFRILILSPLNWTHNRIIAGKKTVLNALLFEYLRQELRAFIST